MDKDLAGLISELGKFPGKPAWVGLLRLRKLILEIRYLENDGNTDSECDFEKDTTNHCKDLVGITKADVTKSLDARLVVDLGMQGEEFYLVNYFRFLAFDKSANKLDPNLGISLIRSNKDDLMEGIELEKRLGLCKGHFDGWVSKYGKLNNEEDEKLKKAIDDELAKDAPEDALAWRNKLKEIDHVLDDPALINDTWKDKWIALGDKFKKVAEVKALFEKVKGKADFLTELPNLSGETDLKTLKAMAAKEPREVIKYIETYLYNHLPDTDVDEKKKKKTQMKRRIAKALNKTKESDLPDADIPENLVKIKTGELLVDMTKTYDAELKEIKTKVPDSPDKKETKEPFLRLNNPWVYAIGALVIVIVGVAIFWDKLVSLFSGDKEER